VRGAREIRPDQRVRFSDTNKIIPSNVATNNNASFKYNFVINSPSTKAGNKIEDAEKYNLLQASTKSSSEPVVGSVGIDEPKSNSEEVVGKPQFVTRKPKNIKTNSSSVYLKEAVEDKYLIYQRRKKPEIRNKTKKQKQSKAKWRCKSSSINSILDIEILKVRGRLNDVLNEGILVDTGARSNVISRETIQKMNLLHQIIPTDIRLSTANNSSLQVLGKIILSVKWQEDKGLAVENINYAE
jgi:hypothetical protein